MWRGLLATTILDLFRGPIWLVRGVTRPFSDPRPIQTLLTSLRRTMECHTYVHRNILYDNPNEEDSLYLLTNGTSSASCDKIVY